jgi:hypothetical protein
MLVSKRGWVGLLIQSKRDIKTGRVAHLQAAGMAIGGRLKPSRKVLRLIDFRGEYCVICTIDKCANKP